MIINLDEKCVNFLFWPICLKIFSILFCFNFHQNSLFLLTKRIVSSHFNIRICILQFKLFEI